MAVPALFHADHAGEPAGNRLFHLGWPGFLLLLAILGGMLAIAGFVLVGMFGV